MNYMLKYLPILIYNNKSYNLSRGCPLFTVGELKRSILYLKYLQKLINDNLYYLINNLNESFLLYSKSHVTLK